MPIWKTLLLRLIALAQRYPGTIAVFGFISGIVSFVTVDRHEAFARVIAIVMLVSWAWLMIEQALRKRIAQRFGWTIPVPVLRYVTQMIHQEGLFFVLPFLYTATTWNSGQALFTGLLGTAAFIALVDPLYFKWLSTRRWLFLTFHTFTLFAVLLTALPLILRVPTGDSYKLALGVAVLLSFPTLSELLSVEARWRKWAAVGLMAALGSAGWLARPWVPPATLWLTEVALSPDLAFGKPDDDLLKISLRAVSMPPKISQRKRVQRLSLILSLLDEQTIASLSCISRLYRYSGMFNLGPSDPGILFFPFQRTSLQVISFAENSVAKHWTRSSANILLM